MIKRSFFLLLTLLSASLYANVKLPKIFSDHMVLQRNQPIHIWGWADANESIKVSLGKATRTTKASAQGKWEVNLPAMKEGGPYTLQVSGRNSIELKDIYLGDVWICSGQSNMEWPLSASANAKQEISQADHPMIRHFKIPRAVQVQPQDDVQGGQWQVCSPSTAGSFTAVGYFFARELYKELKVPIGLINSSWGGTMVETWTSSSSFFSHPEFAHLKNRIPTNLNATVLAQRQALETLIRNLQGKLPTPQEAKNFSLPSYDDAAWKTMNLPAAWENAGLPDVDGEVWFRREFDLPAGADLSNTTLSLGPIDDIDSTFVNGVLVGSVQQYDVPRIYRLPAALLKKGKNIIAVKVTDNQGGGGLYGTAGQMKLTAGDTTVPLNGHWKFRVSKCDMATAVGPNRYPTLLYNAMIHPIVGFPVTGVIWYQGESNAGRAMQYRTAFPLMIRDWRKQWKSELPFYFVQLANFGASGGTSGNGGSEWAELRESQAATLRLPNTGMAVIIDIGESKDIHPRNKQDVGKRLAANALANTYRKKMEYTGPVFKSMKIEGNKAILSFDHAAELEVRPASDLVNGFEIAGADQRFYQATARIEGNRIVVSAPEVTKPAAVRYAWADDPQNLNLYNKAGFPAAPFRTDTWKARTEGVKFSFE